MALHGGYTWAKSTASLDNIVIAGQRATFHVTETTELFFVDQSTGMPPSTAYLAEHSFEAHKVAGVRRSPKPHIYHQIATPHPSQFDDDLPAAMRTTLARAAWPTPVRPAGSTVPEASVSDATGPAIRHA